MFDCPSSIHSNKLPVSLPNHPFGKNDVLNAIRKHCGSFERVSFFYIAFYSVTVLPQVYLSLRVKTARAKIKTFI